MYTDPFDPNVMLHATSGVQLTGGAVGSPFSTLAQSLLLENAGSAPVSLQVFAYADFDVGGDTFNNVTTILGNNLAVQTGEGLTDGRKPDGPQEPCVPLMKFVIDGNEPAVDYSLIPRKLRPLPPVPSPSVLAGLPRRHWELERSGGQWTINGEPFDHHKSYADIPRGSAEVWVLENGGGGWVHPMHIHQEEHITLSRDGLRPPPEDACREDVTALNEGEEVFIYRKFRSFKGRYVAHCHNLAHEDHSMMFGWTIT